ncbi:MAG TPA: dodecin family protein [Thermoanaerobaculia bacterium]|nr:dodecin family protein [Thermoanaerobaculia bacterium]
MPVERSVAKVTEITGESPESFDDACRVAISRASRTIHNMKSAWVAEQHVKIEDGQVAGYRVHLKVTFVLDNK